jgi:hypothetical protein
MKLGIIVDNIGRNELTMHLLAGLHKASEELPLLEGIIFYQDMYMPMGPVPYPVMQVNEAWCFDGVLLGTSLSHAPKLNRLPGPIKKALYVWEPEWALPNSAPLSFNLLEDVYCNKKIQLITRNAGYKKLIESVFNRKDVDIVHNFDFAEIIKCLT